MYLMFIVSSSYIIHHHRLQSTTSLLERERTPIMHLKPVRCVKKQNTKTISAITLAIIKSP